MRAILVNNEEQEVGTCDCPDHCLIIIFQDALFARLPSIGLIAGAGRVYKQTAAFIPDMVMPIRKSGNNIPPVVKN